MKYVYLISFSHSKILDYILSDEKISFSLFEKIQNEHCVILLLLPSYLVSSSTKGGLSHPNKIVFSFIKTESTYNSVFNTTFQPQQGFITSQAELT